MNQFLSELKNGNSRFRKEYMSGDKLASRQTPSILCLCCSDSRVPPEIILDREPGELFVIRTAGHVIGESEIESIEYGIKELGIRAIIVLSHSNCGAVSHALFNSESSKYRNIIEKISPHISYLENPSLESATKSHAVKTVKMLSGISPIIKEISESVEVTAVGIYYDILTGCIEILDETIL